MDLVYFDGSPLLCHSRGIGYHTTSDLNLLFRSIGDLGSGLGRLLIPYYGQNPKLAPLLISRHEAYVKRH